MSLRLRIEEALGVYYWWFYQVAGPARYWKATLSREPIGLNVGSAYTAPEGWANIDRGLNVILARMPAIVELLYRLGRLDRVRRDRFASGTWRRVNYWDVRYPLPFQDDTLAYVYSSHVIEHLEMELCNRLLQDCFRVLKPGGVLRLVVPDLGWGARAYVDILTRVESGALDPDTRVEYLGSPIIARQAANAFLGLIFERDPKRRQAYGHVWMYDALSLCDTLRQLGFQHVRQLGYRQGQVPDLAELDMRPENSLHVEAVKPQKNQGDNRANPPPADRLANADVTPIP